VAERLELIDKAKGQGVDCTADIYPYPTGSTLAAAMLPSYVHDGGPEAMVRRLEDPDERRAMIAEIDAQPIRSLRESVLSYLQKNGHLEGISLPEVAHERGVSMGEAICDLLLEEDLAVGFWLTPPESVAVWRQLSRDAMGLLSRPDYMVGSDSIHTGSLPHPRAYGAFPRFLGRLRRQLDGLSLEHIVQRMTDNPARRFGLTGRGRIQKGYFADIVVFDPERIIDNATYDDPQQFPTGIPFVLVNGQVAVDRERCTGSLAGQAVP
jgi:N-acyl-D-amino-acid deacylase